MTPLNYDTLSFNPILWRFGKGFHLKFAQNSFLDMAQTCQIEVNYEDS